MSLGRLTVMLLRDVEKPDDAIHLDKSPVSIELDPSSELTGAFYYLPSAAHPPPWVGQINPVLSPPIQSVVLDISEHLLDGRIDPDDFGDSGRLWRDATKANRIQLEGRSQGRLTLLTNLDMGAVVH